MVMKDRYTLIERSDTLIVQSYRTLFTVYSQHQGFNFITSTILKLLFLMQVYILRITLE